MSDQTNTERITKHIKKTVYEQQKTHDSSFDQHAVRRLIDDCLSLYENGQVKTIYGTKEAHEPTERAKLLHTLNPETFKAQAKESDLLRDNMVANWREALQAHK